MLKTILNSSGCHQKLTEWYATFHARTIQSQMTVDGSNQRETTLVLLQDQHRSSSGGQHGKYQTHNEIKETKLCVSIHNFNPPHPILPSNCHWPVYCKCLNTSGWEDIKVCCLLYDWRHNHSFSLITKKCHVIKQGSKMKKKLSYKGSPDN